MSDTGRLNLDWAAALIGGLAAAGVREAVISPGARSTPLTLACLRHPTLHSEVVLDERSAAWFALGRARATACPVVLVCTSGTAVANWLPAVIEANQSAVPLILLSADRPPELQGWGANQTIAQADLFAGQVRAQHAPGAPFDGFDRRWLQQLAARAVAESRWPLPGPVHLNLPFREPLLPAEPTVNFDVSGAVPIDGAPPRLLPDPGAVAALAGALSGRRGAIVCGGNIGDADAAGAIAALAARLDCPILADPHSGLRFGPHDKSRLCVAHEHWLRDPARRAALRPDWLLRFGDMPVTRALQAWLGDCEEHHLVEAGGRWPDALHRTRHLLRATPAEACAALGAAIVAPAPAGWLAAFRDADRAAAEAEPSPTGALLASLCRQLPTGSRLFCGNSLPIRELAAWSGIGELSIGIHANRGASGIDGNIATAAGLAADAPTVAVVGDLTAQHDLGSLALLQRHPLVLVVVNNGGGGIFDFLPVAGLPEFERGWRTPQSLRFDAAAAAFGIPYWRSCNAAEAAAAAHQSLGSGQPLVLEFVIAPPR
jgi:2-succinyl-5-enolpyruvyl-6-hydroxy-3-cyclohexene-1-carboxylate synthase